MTTAKKEPAPAPKLVTFTPKVDFLGYPNGKTGVNFKAGVESIPVTPEYAALIRKKGLASD